VKKILLVDDDKTLQTVLTRYLEKRGYSVRVVTSGVQALKLFAQDPPDLVVSDIMMPGMDGLEFCRRLRATSPIYLFDCEKRSRRPNSRSLYWC
jgi:CheY-like chemotaxis protein